MRKVLITLFILVLTLGLIIPIATPVAADTATLSVVSDTSVQIIGVYNKAGGGGGAYVDLSGSPLSAVRAQEPNPYPTGYAHEPPEVTDSIWDQNVDWSFQTNAPGADWIWETERAEGPASDYPSSSPLYDADASTNGRVVVFEKKFFIDGTASSGTLDITADNCWEVWINGILLKRSDTAKVADWELTDLSEPYVGSSGWQHVSHITVDASMLHNGDNTIKILAGNEYYSNTAPGEFNNSDQPAFRSDPYRQMNPGALIFRMSIPYVETPSIIPSTVTTEVRDSGHNPLPINAQIPLASVVYDMANVGPTPILGTVTYTLYNADSSVVYSDPNEPVNTESQASPALPAGKYYWQASYSGDDTHSPATSDPEPFEVLPASISIVKTGTLDMTKSTDCDKDWDKDFNKDCNKDCNTNCNINCDKGKYHVLGKINYTFTVTNTGSATLTNVKVSDLPVLTTGPEPLSVDSLAPNASATFTGNYTLTQADVDAGQVIDVATATGTPPIGDDVTAQANAKVLIPQSASMTLVKKGMLDKDKDGCFDKDRDKCWPNAGDKIKYSFKVTNTGNVTLYNIMIADSPALSTGPEPLSVDSLAPHASAIFTGSYTLTQMDIDAGQVVDTATATGTPPPSMSGLVTAQDSETVRIPQSASIGVVKNGKLAMGVVAPPNKADAGDQINYTFTVKNTGNVTLYNIMISDSPALTTGPVPLSVTSLAPGASTTFTGSYTLTNNDIKNGQVKDTATATGTTPSGKKVIDKDSLTVYMDKNNGGCR